MVTTDFLGGSGDQELGASDRDAVSVIPLTYDGDGVIERADGDLELDGFCVTLNWDHIDPPPGDTDGVEIDDAEAMAELCNSLGLPVGAL